MADVQHSVILIIDNKKVYTNIFIVIQIRTNFSVVFGCKIEISFMKSKVPD